MRRFIFIISLVSSLQVLSNPNLDSAIVYLNEFRNNSEKIGTSLWGIEVRAPILFQDMVNKLVYLSEASGVSGEQKHKDILWVSPLIEELKVSTPTLLWKEKRWVVVPLHSEMKHLEVIEFMAHESFHCVQNQLGIKGTAPSLPHLSTVKGKLYMQAEIFELLEALKQDSMKLVRIHIKNALVLREYRYQLFPEARDIEGRIELNEGLAEYTGMIYANYSRNQLIAEYEGITRNMVNMNSEMIYPYTAGSLYAFFNDLLDKYWKKKVPSNYLHDITKRIYDISFEGNVKEMAEKILEKTTYQNLSDTSNTESSATLKKYFSKERLVIQSAGSSIQFKSTIVISIPKESTVYNNIIIVNPRGKLEVSEQGRVLLNSEQSTIYLNAVDLKINENEISSDGWKLFLNEQFEVQKRTDGNYEVVKKP